MQLNLPKKKKFRYFEKMKKYVIPKFKNNLTNNLMTWSTIHNSVPLIAWLRSKRSSQTNSVLTCFWSAVEPNHYYSNIFNKYSVKRKKYRRRRRGLSVQWCDVLNENNYLVNACMCHAVCLVPTFIIAFSSLSCDSYCYCHFVYEEVEAGLVKLPKVTRTSSASLRSCALTHYRGLVCG